MSETENKTNNLSVETENLLEEKKTDEVQPVEQVVAEQKDVHNNVEHKADDSVSEKSIGLSIEDKKMVMGKLLADFLLDKTKVDKLKIDLNLNTKFLDFLKKVTESYPELLNDIEKSLSDIVSDKVIDSNDIPKLIVLIKNVYKNFNDSNNFKKLFNVTIEDSIYFIKNIILILIELDYIKVKDKNEVTQIIELCIDLLTTSVDVTETLYDRITSCFKC